MGCDCVAEMDKVLAEHNGVVCTTMFGDPLRVAIRVEKFADKVRKRPPVVIASYCPFCGEKYGSTPASRVSQ